MIQVDDRVGSVELIPILQNLVPKLCRASSGIPFPSVTSTRLLCGDACFDGIGTNDSKLLIGVERKRLKDMLNSIRSGRYSGKQLPEMLEYYDVSYLIIEGRYRCGATGDLEHLVTSAHPLGDTLGGKWFPVQIGNQTIRFTELDHFICSMQQFTGVKVRSSWTDYDTAAQIVSLYTHYQKAPEKHHSHQALHTPAEYATIGKAGLVRRVAAALSGIGWQKSADVALKFGTVKEMVEAGPGEWETVRGVGKTLAKRAFDQLRGDWRDPGEL